MQGKFTSQVLDALYRPILTLGVSNKMFAVELALGGIFVLYLHLYIILIPLFIIHITAAILNKKEPNWVEILKFLIKIPDESHAKIN